jgi:NAD(P)-dependent dehydrogenase (short-subunit alcohol dehydrogenase family)
MSLAGKRFIITGAATGLGLATLVAYAKAGAKVVGLYRNRTPGEIDLSGAPGEVHFLRCDVSEKDQMFAAVDEAARILGGLDGLVHSAAIGPSAVAEDISVEEFDHVMVVNARGTMLSNQAVFPLLKEKGGRIINFASSTGVTGLAPKAHYAASKGAVLAWTRSIARAWAPYRITANVVCPAIKTEMYEGTRLAMSPEELARHDALLASTILLGGQFGDADRDLAPLMVFLGGDGADFLTGQTYSVDGGMLMMR